MAKIKQNITVVKTRVKKDGSPNTAGYAICKNCGGDGVVRIRKNKKK